MGAYHQKQTRTVKKKLGFQGTCGFAMGDIDAGLDAACAVLGVSGNNLETIAVNAAS